MARKPKIARSNEAGASPKQDVPMTVDAPIPARRGRKPKMAAISPEAITTMDDDATGSLATASAGVSDAPVRKRPGPKPKQKPIAAEAAATAEEVSAPVGGKKRGRKPRQIAPEPTSGENGAAMTAKSGGPAHSAPAPLPPSPARATKPAAHWDRPTDTVKFDWTAIERTAAEEGPNQTMAKLLVAARAEGAGSRWPL